MSSRKFQDIAEGVTQFTSGSRRATALTPSPVVSRRQNVPRTSTLAASQRAMSDDDETYPSAVSEYRQYSAAH